MQSHALLNASEESRALLGNQTLDYSGRSWFQRTWGTNPSGVSLTWKELRVTCPVPNSSGWCPRSWNKDHQAQKIVLDGVTGCAVPGTLLAIMGASGTGKSTLLNCLSSQNMSGLHITGQVLMNGSAFGEDRCDTIGYLQQHVLFFGTLTVGEHLHFHARLRMDKRVTKQERRKRVDHLLKELGLKSREGTLIGDPHEKKSISGGERKRLAIATQLLTDPSVVLCDEPTTGLDSSMARSVVSMLYKMAADGKTIVCTIHQPSSEIFLMFDRILLLAEGRTAYLGPTYDALDFFSELGYVCPTTYNPADYYITQLACRPGYEQQDQKRAYDICEMFRNSDYSHDVNSMIESIEKMSFSTYSQMQREDGPSAAKYNVNWFIQFYLLLWRSLVQSFRNPSVMKIRTIQKIVLSLAIGAIYFQIQPNQENIAAFAGVLFILITENTFPGMYGVLQVFPLELPLVLRENQNGLYRMDAYYLSKIISLIPGFIFEPFIFTAICYWMIGLHKDVYKFLITTGVLILTSNVSCACGCFFSTAFYNYSMAITVLVPFDVILMVMGGFFVRTASLPSVIGWMQYLSWFRYSFECLMINQWQGLNNITCEEGEHFCVTTGEQVLQDYGFEEDNLQMNILLLFILFVSFHIFGFLALLTKVYKT